MKDSVVKNILVNLKTVFSTNVKKRINDNTRRIAILEEAMAEIDVRMEDKYHYLHLMDYYACHEEEARPYQKELVFLRQAGHYCNFPYPNNPEPSDPVSGRDTVTHLPFVVHEGKKLFFPSTYSSDEAVKLYLNLVRNEKILGVDDLGETPHRYQSSSVHVEEGDAVFDIGAAEGLFSLDVVDKASHVVVVESDPRWMEPLQQTFAPFGDKVTIINKFVSAVDTDDTLSLKKLLSDINCPSAFVKMDIEGYELPSITSAVEVLKEKEGIKMAVAAYHRQHDADELKTLFNSIGYYSESSTGFMLFHLYDTPVPPFFRRGVVRSKKLRS